MDGFHEVHNNTTQHWNSLWTHEKLVCVGQLCVLSSGNQACSTLCAQMMDKIFPSPPCQSTTHCKVKSGAPLRKPEETTPFGAQKAQCFWDSLQTSAAQILGLCVVPVSRVHLICTGQTARRVTGSWKSAECFAEGGFHIMKVCWAEASGEYCQGWAKGLWPSIHSG